MVTKFATDVIIGGTSGGKETSKKDAIDNGGGNVIVDPTRPMFLRYTDIIDRFHPLYWRVDGPSTANFSITNYQNGFQVIFDMRLKDDLVGIVWDSENTKDHKLLRYSTNYDYSDLVWEFDIELSPTMPVLNDEHYAPILTVEYKDPVGRKGIAYIALWNYATTPNSRSSHIRIDWNTVRSGFTANVQFSVKNIQKIFFSGFVTGYEKVHTPLAQTTSGYVRVTNSVVTGRTSKLTRSRVRVDPHNIGMCTSYDDHYDLNPARLVDNLNALGYNGFINHYCGMSHYPVIDWNFELNRFYIPDPLVDGRDVVNEPTKAWHRAYASTLHANNLEPVFSVSWELYSQGAREEWCQREYNDRLGKTGYTPPSYFASLCNPNAIEYLHRAYREFADILVETGCDVIMQIGEPWWWFNVDSTNPCIYDYPTKVAFNNDTGLFAPDLGTIYEAVNKTDPTSQAFKDWLRNKLGQTCQDIRTMLKSHYGNDAKICPLIFFPSIRTHQVSLATYINYPKEHYMYPNFDFVMTEAYDWILEAHLDLSHGAVGEIPLGELEYPRDKVAYLSGFVPDSAIAYIYGFDYEKPYRSPIWQRIFGDLKNNEVENIWKQLIWAYPQVMYDSIVIDPAHTKNGFFMNGLTYYPLVRDNTPYPEDIFGTDLHPPLPDPTLEPIDIHANISTWGDIQIAFNVKNDRPNTTYQVQLLNDSGIYSVWDSITEPDVHHVFLTSTEIRNLNLTGSLKVVVIPSIGNASSIVDIDPVQSDDFIEKVIVFAGQANVLGHFTVLSGDITRKDSLSATDTRNLLADKLGLHQAQVLPLQVAWGSSAIDKLADENPTTGTNYWYNLDSDTNGPRLTEALSIIDPYKDRVHAIIWGQGENDAIAYRLSSPSLSNPTRYTQATNKVLDKLLAVCPVNTKVVWQIMGRSYYGTQATPPESDGVGWKLYRDAQRSIVLARPDTVLGSWSTGVERLSGYIREGDGYLHYTPAVYHTIATELGQAIANNIDRINNAPIWVDLDIVSNIQLARTGEDITITWVGDSDYESYVIEQLNILDGTTIYKRTVTGPTDVYTAQEQRNTYGFLASTVSLKVYGAKPSIQVNGPSTSFYGTL